MTTDVKKYKENLELEKKTLIAELGGLGVHNPEDGSWEAVAAHDAGEATESDENDLADHFTDFEERRSTMSILTERLKDVQDALGHIANNTYGSCEIGGETIEAERLNANPAARTCSKHING